MVKTVKIARESANPSRHLVWRSIARCLGDDGTMSSRYLRFVTASALIALAASSLRGAAPAGPVEFVPHDIDANFRGGYSVAVADFNKDGKPDEVLFAGYSFD